MFIKKKEKRKIGVNCKFFFLCQGGFHIKESVSKQQQQQQQQQQKQILVLLGKFIISLAILHFNKKKTNSQVFICF